MTKGRELGKRDKSLITNKRLGKCSSRIKSLKLRGLRHVLDASKVEHDLSVGIRLDHLHGEHTGGGVRDGDAVAQQLVDPAMEGQVKITVIATGFREAQPQRRERMLGGLAVDDEPASAAGNFSPRIAPRVGSAPFVIAPSAPSPSRVTAGTSIRGRVARRPWISAY